MKPRFFATPCQSVAIVANADGTLPEWVHCVPVGQWRGHWSGREITIGDAELDSIVGAFTRGGIDVVVDFEHQTLNAGLMSGPSAPAAGWLDAVERRPNGIWGHVKEWTDLGTEALSTRRYRYQSPVIFFDHPDRETGEPRVMWLQSLALTNSPFFAGDLSPVIATAGGSSMTPLLAALLLALGLPDTASEEEGLAEVKRLKEMEPMGARACAAIGADPKKALPANAVAKLDKVVNHVGYVPVAEHLETLAAVSAPPAPTETAEQLVARAEQEGKVTPAGRAATLKWAKEDLASCSTWVNTIAQPVVPLARQTSPAASITARAGAAGADADDAAEAAKFGLSVAEYRAGKAQ